MGISSVQLPYAGFPGQVWATCFQALAFLNNLLENNTTTIGQIANPVRLVYNLLRSSITSINAYQTGQALSVEVQNMIAIQALPISLDPTTTNYFNARIASITTAAQQISALQPPVNPFTIVSSINTGVSGLVESGYLPYCMSFSGEVPPAGLSVATLPSFATGAATAWLNVANAIQIAQVNTPTAAFDTAARQFRCATTVANVISQLQSGPFSSNGEPSVFVTPTSGGSLTDASGIVYTVNSPRGGGTIQANGVAVPGSVNTAAITLVDGVLWAESGAAGPWSTLINGNFTLQVGTPGALQELWSSVVALPTILLDGESLATSPSSLAAQQGLTIRFALSQIANQLALLLYAISTAVGSTPVTAILRNAETLLDLAARELGDFEQWPQIAAANGLLPPFPGPTNQAVAMAGQQLYMPGSGVQIGANTTPPTYPDSVMGADYFFGPLNGVQPPWTGEIPTLTGYLNFAAALGRRLQTPLGSLVYHRNYGSRIPAEVGAIQSLTEAQKLVALARAAINADARTGRILSVSGTVQPGFLATIQALVQPKGPSSTPVSLSSKISALPGA